MMYDGISMSVCTSYDYRKKKTVTCYQSMMLMLFLLLVFDAFHTHTEQNTMRTTQIQENYKITVKYNKTITLASIDIAFKCSIEHDIACSEVP